jgi:hypothetical protein
MQMFMARSLLISDSDAEGTIAGCAQWGKLWLAALPRDPAQGPLSGAAKHPAGARPSKCIIIIANYGINGMGSDHDGEGPLSG